MKTQLITTMTELGTCHDLIASTLVSSTWMPSQETTYPRKELLQQRTHIF